MNIIIAVMSCVKNTHRRESIRKTWGKQSSVEISFFVGGQSTDAVCLPCGDFYGDCAEKQLLMIDYCQNYDYAFFCDDDTYVVVDRLLSCGFDNHDYMGSGYQTKGSYAHGGSGYFLSQKAMKSVLAVDPKNLSLIKDKYSDFLVGQMMSMSGIPLHSDPRFNMGRYHGQSAFCNLIPRRDNQYITTHFVTPDLNSVIYTHLTKGIDVSPNHYSVSYGSKSLEFLEVNGLWWWKHKDSDPVGPFDFAENAEKQAFENEIAKSKKLLNLKLL